MYFSSMFTFRVFFLIYLKQSGFEKMFVKVWKRIYNMHHPSIVYHCLSCTQGLLIEGHPIKRVLMPHNYQTCYSSILFLHFFFVVVIFFK